MMGAMLSYSLAAGIYLAACYACYRLLLASARQPGFNRGVLLVSYAVSLLGPLLVTSLAEMACGLFAPARTANAGGGILTGMLTAVTAETPAGGLKMIIRIYVAGMVCVGLTSLWGIFSIARLAICSERRPADGFTLLLRDDCEVPFSFMRFIVMSPSDICRNSDFILTHEYAHIRRLHWLDLILAQAVCVVMWYNPVAWLMRAELRRVHEYQADAAVISSGLEARAYQELIIEKAVGVRLQSLANSLNHSNISKRITMMYQKPSRRLHRLAALALIPALGAAALAMRQPAVAATLDAARSADKVTQSSPVLQAPAVIAEFPDGMEALVEYLSNNIRYPEDAYKAKKEGRVVVRFTVNKDGSVSDPEIIKGVYPSLDAEAVRVVKSMPAWTPARNEAGEVVTTVYTLPVSFKLQGAQSK